MPSRTTLSDQLLDLVAGHRVTAAIGAAVDLGIVEAIAEGPRTSAWVATACSTDEQSTDRLLTALVALGVCERAQQTQFQLTAMGAQLVGGRHHSLRDWALFEARLLAPAWLRLSDSIRSGKTSDELAGTDGGRYEALAGDAKAASLFDGAMISMTQMVAKDVLDAYDFSAAGRLLDVGGGVGTLLIQILRAYPNATGSVFDLPRCEAGARQAIAQAGFVPRADFLPGNFFAGLPSGYDTLLLKNVLHNWDDASCDRLLVVCRRALSSAGRILIIERLLTSDSDASAGFISTALGDLNMLRGPGGCERNELAYRKLATDAGLSVAGVIQAGRYSLLIAHREQTR